MGVYKTKDFARFARKVKLADETLLEAIRDIAEGRRDADLGGGVFKQRVAREGGGKSGGLRTILVFKVGGHGFFVHGFAKNDKANVSAKELRALKALAGVLLGLGPAALETAVKAGELAEVKKGDE